MRTEGQEHNERGEFKAENGFGSRAQTRAESGAENRAEGDEEGAPAGQQDRPVTVESEIETVQRSN
jgi:hypothetical protein